MKWPPGCASAGVACGIKGSGLDAGLLVFDEPVVWAGAFTTNAAAAAPVEWSRARRGRRVRALVVNSGNANACTGEAGRGAVREVVAAAAREVGCSDDEVVVASTGPIGQLLPTDRLVDALPSLVARLDIDAMDFSGAILTTDTTTKTATAHGTNFTVAGVAKGAAMVAPNMATMLAFLVTDADVDGAEIEQSLAGAVRTTFNRISIDGCESTNDSVFLFTTGRNEASLPEVSAAVRDVCASLAEQIASDAEGATKLLRITVTGADDDDNAARLARAVADSVLWRAAAHGGDPNWGRILSALGSSDRTLDLSEVGVSLNGITVFASGEPKETPAALSMAGREIQIDCAVGTGAGRASVLSADISREYVTLNAAGTS